MLLVTLTRIRQWWCRIQRCN